MDSPFFAGIAGELPTYRMLIFGLALVVMMVLRPRGLIAGRDATATLTKQQPVARETG